MTELLFYDNIQVGNGTILHKTWIENVICRISHLLHEHGAFVFFFFFLCVVVDVVVVGGGGGGGGGGLLLFVCLFACLFVCLFLFCCFEEF